MKTVNDGDRAVRGRPPAANPESRARLLEAARHLMGDRPAAQLTLRAVADRAGHDPALLSYYFGNKAGLVRAVIEDAADRFTRSFQDQSLRRGPVAEQLRNLTRAAMRSLEDHPYLAPLLMQQVVAGDTEGDGFLRHLAAPYVSAVTEVVAEGIRTGELRDVDRVLAVVALSATPLFASLLLPVLDASTPADQRDSEQIADALADLLLRGLLALPAAQP